MSDELIKIEINDREYDARPGAMLIEVADQVGIHIPRFCYHKKLSVAANCRMCLVEVEKAPKPLPACATPVTPGMKVWTQSEKALTAQKDTMEFLLINHPLDCPICDQGGECELQDLSMAFGDSASNYHEVKRVVRDKDIGPLVETEMTRCIQCTRCVRFGEEVAGMREMGATGRGERMEIGTYVEKSLQSELSGNIIDICPVGALTAKPSRYTSRAWEMSQTPGIASHDSVGSSINLHTFKKQLVRVVAGENEAVNECWISDRDRFGYEGVNSEDRATSPMVKHNGIWKPVDWNEALDTVAAKLKSVSGNDVGVLASPRATTEELYLLQKMMRAIGVNSIDHRLRQTDFNDQDSMGLFPWLGMEIADLEQQNAFLLIGSNVRLEQPMINHRIRKAVTRNGAQLICVNPRQLEFNYDAAVQCVISPGEMVTSLARIAKASLDKRGGACPRGLESVLADVTPDERDRSIVETLSSADQSVALLGNYAVQHPNYSTLRALAAVISENTSTRLGYLGESANTAGAWLAGALPHRMEAGLLAKQAGQNAAAMVQQAKKLYLLLDVEPERDMDNPRQSRAAMQQAETVIAITPFVSADLLATADIILPGSAFAETSGTYVNAAGHWQSFRAAAKSQGESRPAWKILRVLGNKLEISGFDYVSSRDVRDELAAICESQVPVSNDFEIAGNYHGTTDMPAEGELQRLGECAPYCVDSLVRRAVSLQKSAPYQELLFLNPADAEANGLNASDVVGVYQNNDADAAVAVKIPWREDSRIPPGCALLMSGTSVSAELGSANGMIRLSRGE